MGPVGGAVDGSRDAGEPAIPKTATTGGTAAAAPKSTCNAPPFSNKWATSCHDTHFTNLFETKIRIFFFFDHPRVFKVYSRRFFAAFFPFFERISMLRTSCELERRPIVFQLTWM